MYKRQNRYSALRQAGLRSDEGLEVPPFGALPADGGVRAAQFLPLPKDGAILRTYAGQTPIAKVPVLDERRRCSKIPAVIEGSTIPKTVPWEQRGMAVRLRYRKLT